MGSPGVIIAAMDAATAPLPRNLLDALADAGMDVSLVARQVEVIPERLETGVTAMEADRFLCAAWALMDDPAFGLKAGLLLRPERFGISGALAMASPTFGAAITRKARYNALVWGDAYQLATGGGEWTILVPSPPVQRPYSQARIDLEFASLLAFGRRFTGRDVTPVRVCFTQTNSTYRSRYADVFGCPILFGQGANSITFREQDTDLKLVSANPQASHWLEIGAQEALDQLGQPSFGARVQWHVERLMQGEEPTVTAAAAALCVSPRTLQRKLQAEGLSFSQLVDRTRKDVALRSLQARSPNVMELAFVLGFTDPNSFFRAFKRWTGTTPERYRQSRVSEVVQSA